MVRYTAIFVFIFSVLGSTAYAQQSIDVENITKHFQNMDANNDGVLNVSEVANANRKLFFKLDVNNNDSLSINEILTHDPDPRGKFNNTDVNNNDRISLREYINQKVKTFHVLDTDNDGKMTRSEYVAARIAYQQKHYDQKKN